MAISAKDVQKLREMTGVGMMDCKKALTEADGDFDKAIEWLREKGLAAQTKKAGKIAAEGVSYAITADNGVGVVIEVNSQTDFVAKNEVFQDFVNDPADTDAYFRDISTFGGCTSGPAAALANIEIIERENLLENCTKMGDRLLEGLKGLMAKHPIIGDVRGKGLFAGIEIVKDRATKEPIAEAVANAMVGAAKQAGVLIGKTSRSFREFNNTLTLCPALIATEADIDEIVAGIDKAFTTVEQKFGL